MTPFQNCVEKRLTSREAQRILQQAPTRVGAVAGLTFFECPEYGDEAPLYLLDNRTREFGLSHMWEVPTLDEVL